jgi:CHAT domain-containing protein
MIRSTGRLAWLLAFSLLGALDAAAPPPPLELTPGQRRARERTFRLRLEASQLWAEGQRDKALSLAGQIVSLYERAFPDPREEAISSVEYLAYWQDREGRYADAARSARRALAMRTKLYRNDTHPSVVSTQAYVNQLTWLAGLKRHDQQRVREATLAYEAALVLGLALGGQDNLGQAVSTAQQLRRLYDTLRGTRSPRYLGILDIVGIASLEMATGGGGPKWEEKALEVVREAADRSIDLLGPTHPDTVVRKRSLAFARIQLANQQWQQGQLSSARELLEKAHAALSQLPPPDNWRATGVALDIGFLKLLEHKKPAVRRAVDEAAEDFAKAFEQFSQAAQAKNTEAMDRGAAAAKKASEAFQKAAGTQNRQYLEMLDGVADMYAALDEGWHPAQSSARAEPLRKEAIRITRMLYACDDPVYLARMDDRAGFLDHVASHALEENGIQRAVAGLKEAVALWTCLYGPRHWQTKAGTIDLQRAQRLAASAKGKQAEYAEAIIQLKTVHKWRDFEESVPPVQFRQRVAGRPPKNARDEKKQGSLPQAIKAMEKALRAYEDVFGKKNIEGQVAELGLLYQDSGDFPRAEEYLTRARDLCKDRYGENHPYFAERLEMLAELYAEVGQFGRALQVLEQASQLRAGLARDEAYAANLKSLALLYFHSGQLFKAEELLRQSLQVLSAAEGETSEDYTRTLRDYAVILAVGGYGETAESLLIGTCHALRLRAAADDQETASHFGAALHTLGLLYQIGGRRPLAETLRRRGLEELNKGAVDDFPDGRSALGDALLAEAAIALFRGDDAAAARYAEHAWELLRALSRGGEAQAMRAKIAYFRGQYDLAREAFHRSLDLANRELEHAFAVTSERQHLALVKSMAATLDVYVQFTAATRYPADKTYQRVLQWKGAAFARQYQRRLQGLDPGVLAELREAARLGQVDRLEEAQRRLMNRRPEVALALKTPTPEAVRQALPPNAALIDFLEFSAYTRRGKGPGTRWQKQMRMAVFVLRRGQPTVYIDLGPSRPIEQAVHDWRVAIGVDEQRNQSASSSRALSGTVAGALPWYAPGLALRRLLWLPMREAVGDADVLLISADGILSGFPFAALPTEEGQPESYLLRSRQVALVPAAQLLPRYLADEPARSVVPPSLLLVGDVCYDASPGKPLKPRSPVTGRDPAVVFRTSLRHLAKSKDEVKEVGELFAVAFPGATAVLLDRDKATEQAFREAAPGKCFLMLSTHGGYAGNDLFEEPDLDSAHGKVSPTLGMDRWAELVGPNPWQTCGIALTGVNKGSQAVGDLRAPTVTDDGILTGLEVAELQLAGTDLVLISNCETGVGLSVVGEGMVSLQRAFQIAGVRTTVATYWPVRGGTSLDLTGAFFRNLWGQAHMTKLTALQRAQLLILDSGKGDSSNPRHWAAWSLSGHPGAARVNRSVAKQGSTASANPKGPQRSTDAKPQEKAP